MTGKFKITLQWSNFYAKSSHPWTWNFKLLATLCRRSACTMWPKVLQIRYLIFSYFFVPRNLKFFLVKKIWFLQWDLEIWDLKKGLAPLWPDATAVVAEIYTWKSCDLQLTEQDWKTKTEKSYSLQGCAIMPDYN